LHSAADVKVKICKYCGEEIEEPVHGNQKYHHEVQEGQTETCAELARRENNCEYVRKYRKKFKRTYCKDLGSRNARLGSSALSDFDKELELVHREKQRLLGY